MGGMYDADKTTALRILEVGETIVQAESEKTPMLRLLPRGDKPKQMLATWPVKQIPRRAFTGTMDGVDQTTFDKTNRDAIEAYGMLMRTPGWLVSILAQVTDSAGVPGPKEKAEQAYTDGVTLNQMIERSLLSNLDHRPQSGVDVPYRIRGALSWLDSTEQTLKPVPASYRPTSTQRYTGALASLTEAVFQAMVAAASKQIKGPVNLTGHVGLDLKAQMSGWAVHDTDASATDKALRSYTLSMNEKKIMRTVDMFQFDAGSVVTFLSHFLGCNEADGEDTAYTPKSGIFIDLEMWELCWYIRPRNVELPDLGAGPRGYNEAAYLLKCKNPLGQMSVYTNS